jgi:fused signal recognition particle receptor
MSRDWSDLILAEASANAQAHEQSAEGGERRRGLFKRLRENLAKTRHALGSEIQATLFTTLDEHTWERLEEALIMADVGASTTASVVETLEREATEGGLSSGEALTERLIELLADTARGEHDKIDIRAKPTVIMAVGVNGTGKTTTIGKLAQKLREHGRSVTVGAADTFRAAAEEQLEVWAKRAGAQFVGGERGADPASVAYDAVGAGGDVVIVDTAGRLHTQTNLMDELTKVHRVIGRRLEGAPHEVLLVLDATTGQNGLQQAKLFSEAVGVTGVALTKLDGSAKGGIAVPIAFELGLPVKLIGVGEGLDDLRPFDPLDFARALVSD